VLSLSAASEPEAYRRRVFLTLLQTAAHRLWLLVRGYAQGYL
jgi:hypothetical protein